MWPGAKACRLAWVHTMYTTVSTLDSRFVCGLCATMVPKRPRVQSVQHPDNPTVGNMSLSAWETCRRLRDMDIAIKDVSHWS